MRECENKEEKIYKHSFTVKLELKPIASDDALTTCSNKHEECYFVILFFFN